MVRKPAADCRGFGRGLRQPPRRLVVGLLLGLVVAGVAEFGPPQHAGPALASCGAGCQERWNLEAISPCGSCTTPGTEYSSVLPSHWSVPQDSDQFDVMNEAAWLIDKNNGSQATETGYFSGWWPYSSPEFWNVGLMAYGTAGNGTNGASRSSNYLTGGNAVRAYSVAYGQQSQVVQGSSVFWNCNCWPVVNSPRENAAQGEVHAYDTDFYLYPWLNNCSPGEEFSMSFQNTSGGWAAWGGMSLSGAASPYWYTQQSASQWSNGGC